MSMFDEIRDKVELSLSDWIQVIDPTSKWTLNNVEIIKDVGVNPKQVTPHCVKCVVVNQCWFKNEKNKKPEPFGYDKYSTIILNKLKGTMGLYHPRCHCKEIAISTPTERTLKIIIEDEKIDDCFNRKFGILNSWGYTWEDWLTLKNSLYRSVMENYIKGNYKLFKYDGFGFQISLQVSVPGIHQKTGREYKFITGFMVYPNGQIRNTTFFGGKIK